MRSLFNLIIAFFVLTVLFFAQNAWCPDPETKKKPEEKQLTWTANNGKSNRDVALDPSNSRSQSGTGIQEHAFGLKKAADTQSKSTSQKGPFHKIHQLQNRTKRGKEANEILSKHRPGRSDGYYTVVKSAGTNVGIYHSPENGVWIRVISAPQNRHSFKRATVIEHSQQPTVTNQSGQALCSKMADCMLNDKTPTTRLNGMLSAKGLAKYADDSVVQNNNAYDPQSNNAHRLNPSSAPQRAVSDNRRHSSCWQPTGSREGYEGRATGQNLCRGVSGYVGERRGDPFIQAPSDNTRCDQRPPSQHVQHRPSSLFTHIRTLNRTYSAGLRPLHDFGHFWNVESMEELTKANVKLIRCWFYCGSFFFFQALHLISDVKVVDWPGYGISPKSNISFKEVFHVLVEHQIDLAAMSYSIPTVPIENAKRMYDFGWLETQLNNLHPESLSAVSSSDFLARWWLLCGVRSKKLFPNLIYHLQSASSFSWDSLEMDPMNTSESVVGFLGKMRGIQFPSNIVVNGNIRFFIEIIRSVLQRIPHPLEVVYWLWLIVEESTTSHFKNGEHTLQLRFFNRSVSEY